MENLEKSLKEIGNTNLYKILGIEKTDDEELIKKAYRKMTKFYHPDKNKNSNAADIFQKIQKTYVFLKNAELKGLYDSMLDKKEEKLKRIHKYTEDRKKFANDLKKREEEYVENRKNEFVNRKHQREKTFKKEDEKEEEVNNKPVKINHENKPINEKLNAKGIEIKWKKDIQLEVSKEMIKAFFDPYGQIEEIILKEKKNKGYILFSNFRSINNVLETDDTNLKSLFEILKFKKKSDVNIENEKNKLYQNMKSSYLDSETLNRLKNAKLMSNVNFLNKIENVKKQEELDKQSKIKTNIDKIDFSSMSVEDFEKALFKK
jgi:curved DNA-binding protein CbpA